MNLIAAVSKNRGIGLNGSLLCHLPEDLKYFKETTLNKKVLMGYNTLISLPGSKPLPNRENFVLTRKDIKIEGATVVHTIAEALEKCGDDCFVMGGDSVYRQLLPFCRYAYVTHIQKSFEADSFFPELGDNWKLVQESSLKEHKGIRFTFRVYKNLDLCSISKKIAKELYPKTLFPEESTRIMSNNVLHVSYNQKYISEDRLKIAAGYYRHFCPDSLGLQEFHRDLSTELLRLMGEDYAFTLPLYPEGPKNYTPIIYRKDRLKLISSDHLSFLGENRGLWSYTYALYQRHLDSKLVLHVNLHYHYDKALIPDQAKKVNELIKDFKEEYPDCMICITGDHNSEADSPEFLEMTRDTDLKSACLLTDDHSQRGNTWHTPDIYQNNTDAEIDHAVINTDVTALVKYCRICDPFIAVATDHYPIYVDIKAK
ncbi:MAG: hypothetical protein E7646_04515 [Ruminococcaceae bacterium]|nr:hypothetical protein [Oscillospiraceae bacterium]